MTHRRECSCLSCLLKVMMAGGHVPKGVTFVTAGGTVVQNDEEEPTAEPTDVATRTLADVYAEQLAELEALVPDGWQAPAELPDPTGEELERYDVAIAWAKRHCDHSRGAREILYRREYQCLDCGWILRP
jgi:hypothetical protein